MAISKGYIVYDSIYVTLFLKYQHYRDDWQISVCQGLEEGVRVCGCEVDSTRDGDCGDKIVLYVECGW